jgi:hypothetical protein
MWTRLMTLLSEYNIVTLAWTAKEGGFSSREATKPVETLKIRTTPIPVSTIKSSIP